MRNLSRLDGRGPSLAATIVLYMSALPAPAAPLPALSTHAAAIVSFLPTRYGSRGCQSVGSALGLGRGLVVTAGHVLLTGADLEDACRLGAADATSVRTEVRVGRTGGVAEGRIVASGVRRPAAPMSFLASADYAILRAEGSAAAASPLAPCVDPPRPGRRVLVLLPSGGVPAAIAATQTPKGPDDAAYIDLSHVFDEGSSGSGVLDAATRCVLGVISHRFPEPHPIVTRVTPVSAFEQAWDRAIGRETHEQSR